ncbi:proline dehydrogenase family protein [Paraflavitalea sp. CAU 1676]|uniref:proline dehydrogenase family protein n=1 Tax=Paraflavitalea sp. CAU 1676 TaxID=3032598 RepID=UPI0023DAC863|nr:proline dehydrogenase family protein [Paraflavitalea sp. CAU 1676]MDF2190315.1 proline dehydrogenase family protein [Paraflavitalea sp. CAU 1676]
MENELLNLGAMALRKAALNEEAKAYILSNPKLFHVLKKAADRYIGGETLEETIGKVKLQNEKGFKCSIEFMGESTRTEIEANAARDEFIKICQEIKQQKLYSTISLDLSHIGLTVSTDLCRHNLNLICQEAAKGNIEVIISAEDAGRTDAVLHVYNEIVKVHPNVAITLQAYLHRTQDDFKEVIKNKGRIRIVKGAFETPTGLSLPRGEELDHVYLGYVDKLLSENHLCSIATHDKRIQHEAKALIQQYKTKSDVYEFESLYGIQYDQLLQLKEEGYSAKLYLVYGKEWYLYLCNRIAEYPLNLFQALIDIVE